MSFLRQALLVDTVIRGLSRIGNGIGAVVLALMMLTTVLSVFMRYVLSSPLLGVVELTEYMMVIVVFLGLGWCEVKRAHVKVETIIALLSPRTARVVEIVTYVLGLVMLSILVWRAFAGLPLIMEVTSDTLEIPAYPFYLVMAIGISIFALVALGELIRKLREPIKR